MTATELTETQKAIIRDLGQNWQQKTFADIMRAVPASMESDITALVISDHLDVKQVSQQFGFFTMETKLCRLTIRGECVADTLKGQNSAEIEQEVVSRVLLAVDAAADKTLPKNNIKETAVGPERLVFLLGRMERDALLISQRVAQGWKAYQDVYQLTVAGERVVDVLVGRDSNECERAATVAILSKLEAEPEGVPTASRGGQFAAN